MSSVISFLFVKVLPKKSVKNILIKIAEYVAKQTDNKLDDQIVAEIKKSLEE